MNYFIPKNWHYSLPRIPKLHWNTNSIEFIVNFNENCLYENNDGSVNKLYGISWGYHMNNSFRIGWNCKDGQLNIYSFAHENSVELTQHLAQVPVNQDILIKVDFNKELEIIVIKWTYNFVNYSYHIDYTYPKWRIGYYLSPFFGGKPKASHKMNIKIIQK